MGEERRRNEQKSGQKKRWRTDRVTDRQGESSLIDSPAREHFMRAIVRRQEQTHQLLSSSPDLISSFHLTLFVPCTLLRHILHLLSSLPLIITHRGWTQADLSFLSLGKHTLTDSRMNKTARATKVVSGFESFSGAEVTLRFGEDGQLLQPRQCQKARI